ncbi:MAG: hypothetical protein RI958_414 [Actinomycetota bacterium]|jgi:hypothetical protein
MISSTVTNGVKEQARHRRRGQGDRVTVRGGSAGSGERGVFRQRLTLSRLDRAVVVGRLRCQGGACGIEAGAMHRHADVAVWSVDAPCDEASP